MTTDAQARASRRRKTLLATALLTALLLLFPVRRAIELAADPTGPKDCVPMTADTDVGKATQLQVAHPPELPWSQRGGTINDASCLSRTSVHGVVQVKEVDDVRTALAFATANGLKVSAAGVRHSMGGHAFAPNAVVLDMTGFNRMTLDENARVLTVQSGATCTTFSSICIPGLP